MLRCQGLGSLRVSWSLGNSGIISLKALVPSPFGYFCPPALYFGGRTCDILPPHTWQLAVVLSEKMVWGGNNSVLLNGEISLQNSHFCGSISIPVRAASHSGAAALLPMPSPSPAAASVFIYPCQLSVFPLFPSLFMAVAFQLPATAA